MALSNLNRRAVILGLIALPTGGYAAGEALRSSLFDRAKWKSLDKENWINGVWLERARPSRAPLANGELQTRFSGSSVDRLKSLIALAEAGPKGYDAFHYGAKIPPPKRPTRLSLGDIFAWIKATPGQPHAIGRYQFIPPTLASLVKRAGLTPNTRFTAQIQDHLADLLLADAGLTKFQKGQMSRERFMDNLAKIWAGLPNRSGKSHYHGYAGNKATITRAYFDTQMQAFFPMS